MKGKRNGVDKPAHVVPRTLVVGRLVDEGDGIVDLGGRERVGKLGAAGRERLGAHKEALVPRAVVAHVAREQALDVHELGGPHRRVRKRLEQPLAVRPRVVVLAVKVHALLAELELRRHVARAPHHGLAVVPQLVVLRVHLRNALRQLELRRPALRRRTQRHQTLAAVVPRRVVALVAQDHLPAQLQRPLAVLLRTQHCTEVVHRLAEPVAVRNATHRRHLCVRVLGHRLHVRPLGAL